MREGMSAGSANGASGVVKVLAEAACTAAEHHIFCKFPWGDDRDLRWCGSFLLPLVCFSCGNRYGGFGFCCRCLHCEKIV